MHVFITLNAGMFLMSATSQKLGDLHFVSAGRN